MIQELISLDKSLFLFLNSLHAIFLNQGMIFLSSQIIWAPLLITIIWKASKKVEFKILLLFLLFFLLTIAASDVTSSYIIKNIFARLRPCQLEELKPLIYSFGQKCGGRFGFVSSHAANSVAFVLYSIRSNIFKSKKIYFLYLLPILVSYSRIYLGVHYPADIIGGIIVGIFWGFFFSWIFRKSELMGPT